MIESVSLLAVPLPIAMASISYLDTSCLMLSCDSFVLLCGALGKITVCCNRLPSEFRQTTLQPVLNPGSIPKVLFCPNGAARSSWRRFSAKTLMASASACSFARAKTSFFIAGKRSRLYPSSMAS